MTKKEFFRLCSDHGVEMGGMPAADGGYPMDPAFASQRASDYVWGFKFSEATLFHGREKFQLAYFRSRSFCQIDYEDHKRPF